MILALLFFAFLGVTLIVRKQVTKVPEDVIWNHIYIDEVDVSGMNAEQAKDALEQELQKYGATTLRLSVEEVQENVTLNQLGFYAEDVDHLIEQAVAYGKEGGIWQRYRQLRALEKEKKGQIGAKLHISLKATLLCLVTISIIEILSTSYFIPYNDIVVYGLMIAFGAALCFAFEHKQYRIIGLVAGAAFILLFGVMMGSQVKRGFMEVVQLVIDRVNTTGAVSIPELQLAYNVRSESDITIFMCVASIAIVYLLSIGIVLVRNLLIVVCVTLPLLEIGIYYGVLPSYIWYGILIACWCTLFALELPRSQAEEDYSGTYMGFALLAISLVAMVVIAVVIPKSSYDKSPKFAKLRQELTDNGTNPLFSRFGSHLTGASSTANGGLGEGKLGNVDKINFSGKTALVVTCPNVADTVYLKGFVAADYEGNEWNNYNDENQWQRSPLNKQYLPH